MSNLTKRKKGWAGLVEANKSYDVLDALGIVKGAAKAKFDESIDVAVNLGIDAKKSDQSVRGSVVLPAGTGKNVRVAVFTQGDKVAAAKAAGADIVGMEDLAEQIKAGKIDFDVAIASPDAMRVVGTLGQILGPRGLMPNPKVGTVTMDIAGAVAASKGGAVEFRVEKAGIVQGMVGKVSFEQDKLIENIKAFVDAVARAKPQGAKGTYIQRVAVSSTMGPGVKVDPSTVTSGAPN